MNRPVNWRRLQWALPAVVFATASLYSAMRLNPEWVSLHVTQLNLWPEPNVDLILPKLRWILAALGTVAGIAALLLLHWFRGLHAGGIAGSILRTLFAIACALAAFEGYLRWREEPRPRPRVTHELFGAKHPKYGWTWAPLRTGAERVAGREVHWAFNREGIRVSTAGGDPDPSAATILFTGESIAAGQGLEYEETYPAQIAAHLHLQAVNLAVNGYGLDQAYLRLVDAIPKYSRLVATVTLFLPVQISRNLSDDKPRLILGRSGTPDWVPAVSGVAAGLRIRKFLYNDLPYIGDAAIERSLTLSAALLRDTAERTRARGATPLFVIPCFVPDKPHGERREGWLIRSLFERQHLPYAVVDLTHDLLLDGDPHPNPRGAAAIAAAIERALLALSNG